MTTTRMMPKIASDPTIAPVNQSVVTWTSSEPVGVREVVVDSKPVFEFMMQPTEIKVESKSSPGTFRTVTVSPHSVTCDCPGCQYNVNRWYSETHGAMNGLVPCQCRHVDAAFATHGIKMVDDKGNVVATVYRQPVVRPNVRQEPVYFTTTDTSVLHTVKSKTGSRQRVARTRFYAPLSVTGGKLIEMVASVE